MKCYILDEKGEPTPAKDLMEWANWFETDARVLRWEAINGVAISTIFFGLDLGIVGMDPDFWETLIIGGPLDQTKTRCSGPRSAALAMHQRAVDRVAAIELL